jgi:hypothetical protein
MPRSKLHGKSKRSLFSDEDYGRASWKTLPPSYPENCLGRVRLAQGRTDEAVQLLAASATLMDRGLLGYAYARSGRREEAEKLVTSLSQYDPVFQGLIFAGLGDKDRTLDALERMAPLGPFRIGRALAWPEFSLVRGDPRVKALRKRVGLPE